MLLLTFISITFSTKKQNITFHSEKRMTEQEEQPPELIKLKNEILPMFKLLQNNKETISQEQCNQIFKALRFQYQWLSSDPAFLTINDVCDKAQQRDIENLKGKYEQLHKSLTTFEYYQKGYVEMSKLKSYILNIMTEDELMVLLKLHNIDSIDELETEELIAKLLKE